MSCRCVVTSPNRQVAPTLTTRDCERDMYGHDDFYSGTDNELSGYDAASTRSDLRRLQLHEACVLATGARHPTNWADDSETRRNLSACLLTLYGGGVP